MRERNAEFHSEQHRQRIHRRAQRVYAVGFFHLLTEPELLEVTESHVPEHRERLYPPTVTLSMFMRQALDADGSFQKAVNCWAAQRRAEGLSAQSVRTGGYCKARERLPVSMVTAKLVKFGRFAQREPPVHEELARRGCIVALQDYRGRFNSDGVFDPAG